MTLNIGSRSYFSMAKFSQKSNGSTRAYNSNDSSIWILFFLDLL